jgi:hypothetical protein
VDFNQGEPELVRVLFAIFFVAVFLRVFEKYGRLMWFFCGQSVVNCVANVVCGRVVFKGLWILQIFGIYFSGAWVASLSSEMRGSSLRFVQGSE